MLGLLQRQSAITIELEKIETNFGKDGADRKTPEYLQKRIQAVDELWGEFEQNHAKIITSEDKSGDYFTKDIYKIWKGFYQNLRESLSNYPGGKKMDEDANSSDNEQSTVSFSIPKKTRKDKGNLSNGLLEELFSQQKTNFRAFYRIVRNTDVSSMEERWEIEDQLKEIQHRWRAIDELHLRIDNILQGSDEAYENRYTECEMLFNKIKKQLNQKLCSTAHLRESTPKVEIPIFTGKYSQWPSFFDLFADTIHNNNFLTKAQKMQHLKSKVKGEAERLIQHLNITSENYDTAWDLLTHRYNNPQALFTYQIETFLNQPTSQKQSSFELKRLYDTTMECIHAIHNLGVDTTTWDPILVHLICKKLDTETYRDYREARKAPRDLPSLDELMDFIEGKFVALEPINKKEKEISVQRSNPNQVKQYNIKFNHPGNYNRKYQALATYSKKCPVCYNDHDLYQCKRFLNMSPDAKMKSIAKHRICENCLYQHFEKPCTSTKRCKACNGVHNSIIHDAAIKSQSPTYTNLQRDSGSSTSVQTNNNNATKQLNVNCIASDDVEKLLSTVQLRVKAADNTYVTLRALLDQCSQSCLVSEKTAQMLGLRRHSQHASISGVGCKANPSKGKVILQCQSIYGDYEFTTEASVLPSLVNYLPSTTFGKQTWPHLQNLKLADPEYHVSRPIDILLDVSIYKEVLMKGLIKGPADAPLAQKTHLGWILSGDVKTFYCHAVINNVDEISKFWEIEDIHETSSPLSKQDQYCEEFYQATTRRLEDGRYEVALPMKPDFELSLGASKNRAIALFKNLEKKMAKNPSLSDDYKKFIHEYQTLQHMQPADVTKQTNTACYIPYHAVEKLDSTTTAFRIVFNFSAKTLSGYSLNDLMECGPNLQRDLQGLILEWRTHKYVITADIEKMFRQILIRESDQPLQSIIWRDSAQDLLQEYQLSTVTYGSKAAPYLAIRTLRQIAQDYSDKYPLASSALKSSFYMDDLLAGHDSKALTKELQIQLIQVLKEAGMNLRKWSSNDPELIKDLPASQLNAPFEFKDTESRKTLGIRWNPATDTFTFQNKIDYQLSTESHTKRHLLSDISKIYDPLGWLSPITIKAKILFQRTWISNIKWDDNLPAEILQEWRLLRTDLKNIESFTIPRYLGDKTKYELHGFSDSSEKAFSCAAYVTTTDDKGERTSRLIAAKTRVAPHSKQISLPRLELLGALLLSQLMKKVTESIQVENITINAWTDSMVVLGWLKGDISRWKQFVANRVKQITDVIPASNWRHVKSEENPADCATRGLTAATLQKHKLWWRGPQWLTSFKLHEEPPTQFETPTIELKKVCVNTALCDKTDSFITSILKNNSSLTRAVRIIGWISRFVTQLRNKQRTSQQATTVLSSAELQAAQNIIVRHIQSLDFEDDINQLRKNGHVRPSSKIASLCPYLDENQILKVGGRLANANINNSAKHPVVLSSHSRLTELIINQAHITTLHGGPRLTLTYIRNKYWIISGIRTVKKQLRQCVRCRRFSQETQKQIMADLPTPRVVPSRIFANVGVDFTGFVEIKANKWRTMKIAKAYVAVFVCLATKAVHLELVSDLSTGAFLAAFIRFKSRRGTPKHVYSDNGTNFVGASRVLKKEYKAILDTLNNNDFIKNINEMEVTWHFNAPSWPSAGGLWEAGVKSLKHHLKRVVGDQKLTYEEFNTLLHQIEACMNSRPLCPLTENADDDCLTPGHFLVGDSLLSRPQSDPDTISLPIRWRLVQAINKQFWKKWSGEYLQQLQARSKWRTPTKNLQIDDIVIIKEDNMPPGKWAIARVLDLHPGNDGYVRVVTLKTQNNVIKRPVNKLILLPRAAVSGRATRAQHAGGTSRGRQNERLIIHPTTSFSFTLQHKIGR